MARTTTQSGAFQEELQRVLASDSFRSAEALRRLLSYLAEAHLSGTDRQLKEYTIGRDVMGKPDNYDPRVDASVRVQVGKLRQRLERYYSTEAPGSPYLLTLPKGHFSLAFDEVAPPPLDEPASLPIAAPSSGGWKWIALGLAVLVLLLAGILVALWRNGRVVAPLAVAAPGEFHEFWQPFVDSRKPAIVVLGSPMFVRFNTHYFRSPWANEWKDAEREVPLAELTALLKSPTPPTPTYRWTPFGEAAAAFRLAVVLGPLKDLVLKRSTVLAWEDVRSSNLIFLGPAKFNRQLPDLPIDQDFVIEQGAIRNLKPRPGEAARYQKPSAPDVEDIPEDYAVITRVRGVTGWGEVLVLASTSTEGTWAAAEYLTTPAALEDMMKRLRAATGSVPDNYQVVIKSRFKSQVPIHTGYVTHHEVRIRGGR
ncbi:MAG: hypothetical protein JNM66_11960 [Bryobacterales bacterium]|nr:hypothetical protein [Bryobacterales bacterium]